MAVGLNMADDDAQETCEICGELDYRTDMHCCAGCEKLCCQECIDWCADEDDPDYGDYFCIECQGLPGF